MSTSGIIKGLLSYRLSFSLGRVAFACFIPIFAATYLGLSPTLVGVLLAVNILLMVLLQPLSGNIADRFNRRALVIIGNLTNFTFLALIPLVHNFYQLLEAVCPRWTQWCNFHASRPSPDNKWRQETWYGLSYECICYGVQYQHGYRTTFKWDNNWFRRH